MAIPKTRTEMQLTSLPLNRNFAESLSDLGIRLYSPDFVSSAFVASGSGLASEDS